VSSPKPPQDRVTDPEIYALARALGCAIVRRCPAGWNFTLMLFEKARGRSCYVSVSADELPDNLYIRMISPPE
jgi:hypothetical protein